MYPFENASEFIRKVAKRVQAFNFETYHVFSSAMLNYLYDICIPSVWQMASRRMNLNIL